MIDNLSPLFISLKTATIATIITFFLGITAAHWMFRYRGQAKSLIDGLFLSPLVLPPTVLGFLLLVIFGKNTPIGALLAKLNINIVFTWYATIITATIVAFPLMYKTALAAFEQIDNTLPQAAQTLGTTERRIFWRVSLPLAFPGLVAGATLAFTRALGEFGATLMLAGNIPKQTQTIPMAIYLSVEAGSMKTAWFWCLVMVSLSLLMAIIVNFWRKFSQKRGNELINSSLPSLNFSESILNTSEPYLSVHIHKQLSGFSLDVSFNSDRQVLGLLGGSGAGKSLILRCIAGIDTPDSGRIVLNGRVLYDSKQGVNMPSYQRRVGLLFQNYALFPHLTVAENIAFGMPKYLKYHGADIEAQLAAVHLSGLGDRYPHQLSGGQQQRVALARALASQPDLLLLDEPCSALDTYLHSQMLKLLVDRLESYNGVSLFVTHNLEEAYRICQGLLVLDQGKVIAFGDKQDIFTNPRYETVARLTGCKNFSRAKLAEFNQKIFAIDWNCALKTQKPIPDNLKQIALRAHHLIFTSNPEPENTFPCWLADTSETPHRMTLYLTLNRPPNHHRDYHLQAEIFKEKWTNLQGKHFPWYVCLQAEKLILLQDKIEQKLPILKGTIPKLQKYDERD